jgi:hypothetical protein
LRDATPQLVRANPERSRHCFGKAFLFALHESVIAQVGTGRFAPKPREPLPKTRQSDREDELLLQSEFLKFPTVWSHDGRFIISGRPLVTLTSTFSRSPLAAIGSPIRYLRAGPTKSRARFHPMAAGWPTPPTNLGAMKSTYNHSHPVHPSPPVASGRSQLVAGAIQTGAAMAGRCSTLRPIGR